MLPFSAAWLASPGVWLATLGAAPAAPACLPQTLAVEVEASAGFEASGLAESLTHPDHVEREATFAAVVESARVNQELFAWLCARAGDPAPTELSWTCRLAVREIQRSEIERQAFGHREPQRKAAHVGIFLRSEHTSVPNGPNVPPNGEPGGAGQKTQPPAAFGSVAPGNAWIAGTNNTLGAPLKNLPPGITSELWVTSFEIDLKSEGSRPNGSVSRRNAEVTLRVIEPQGGQWVEQEFSAENFETLLERHPELGRRMEILMLQQQNAGALGRLMASGSSNAAPSLSLDPSRLGTYVEPDRSGAGLRVHDVVPGSLGQILGLSRGDLLQELNGKPMRNNDDISRVLQSRAPEGQVWATWMTASGIQKSATWQP